MDDVAGKGLADMARRVIEGNLYSSNVDAKKRVDDLAGNAFGTLGEGDRGGAARAPGRGLHSFTFQLNLSRV